MNWGVAKLANAPSCLDGGDNMKVHLGGSSPSPPAFISGTWRILHDDATGHATEPLHLMVFSENTSTRRGIKRLSQNSKSIHAFGFSHSCCVDLVVGENSQ